MHHVYCLLHSGNIYFSAALPNVVKLHFEDLDLGPLSCWNPLLVLASKCVYDTILIKSDHHLAIGNVYIPPEPPLFWLPTLDLPPCSSSSMWTRLPAVAIWYVFCSIHVWRVLRCLASPPNLPDHFQELKPIIFAKLHCFRSTNSSFFSILNVSTSNRSYWMGE